MKTCVLLVCVSSILLGQMPPSASPFAKEKYSNLYNNTLSPHAKDNEMFFNKNFFDAKQQDRKTPTDSKQYPLFYQNDTKELKAK